MNIPIYGKCGSDRLKTRDQYSDEFNTYTKYQYTECGTIIMSRRGKYKEINKMADSPNIPRHDPTKRRCGECGTVHDIHAETNEMNKRSKLLREAVGLVSAKGKSTRYPTITPSPPFASVSTHTPFAMSQSRRSVSVIISPP